MKTIYIIIICSLIFSLILIVILSHIHFLKKKIIPTRSILLSEKYINPSKVNYNGREIWFFRNWSIKKSFIVTSSGIPLNIKNDNLIMGYEDPRSILMGNKIYIFATGVTNESALIGRYFQEMYLIELNLNNITEETKAIKIKYPFKSGPCKNFMPFIYKQDGKDKLYFIYSLCPEYVILELNTDTCLTSEVIRKKVDLSEFSKYYLKGGSKGCFYKDYLYFTIHKSTSLFNFKNMHYLNYLIKVSPHYPFNIIQISAPFILTNDSIIFGEEDIILFMIINFGTRHIDFVSDMEISVDGRVQFIYGYGDEISLSTTSEISNFFN